MKLAVWCVVLSGLASGLVGGCGNDDCQKYFDKFGTKPSDTELAACRTHLADFRKDPKNVCVLEAANRQAAELCVAETPEGKAKEAAKLAQQAAKDAEEAAAKVQQLATDLDALTVKTAAAIDAVANAQSAADREAGQAKLAALQKEKAELEARVAEAQAAAAKAERSKGVHISKECLENPLAKGCS